MESTPTNKEVAEIFTGIADMLEADGENPYKVRAYRNAVETIEDLPEPIAVVAGRGELKRLPGFGESLIAKTQEILTTGTCALYEQLKAERAARATDSAQAAMADGDSGLEDERSEIPSPW